MDQVRSCARWQASLVHCAQAAVAERVRARGHDRVVPIDNAATAQGGIGLGCEIESHAVAAGRDQRTAAFGEAIRDRAVDGARERIAGGLRLDFGDRNLKRAEPRAVGRDLHCLGQCRGRAARNTYRTTITRSDSVCADRQRGGSDRGHPCGQRGSSNNGAAILERDCANRRARSAGDRGGEGHRLT